MRGSKLIIENLPLKNSKGCFFEESVQQPFDNCLSSCLAIGSGLAFSIWNSVKKVLVEAVISFENFIELTILIG